jgi:hypothetical protein
MFPIIKNKAWEEIVQEIAVLVALICTANISVQWLQVVNIAGWGLVILPLI